MRPREVHTAPVASDRAEAPAGVVARELLIGAICVSIAVLLLGLLVGIGLLPDPRSSEGPGMALGFLYSPISLLLGAAMYRATVRLLEPEPEPEPERGPERGPGLEEAPLVAAWVRVSIGRSLGICAVHIALAILGSYLIAYLMSLLGMPVSEQKSILEITGGGLSLRPALLLLLFTALVAAPIAEELLLRGLFFRRLWQQAGPGVAYIASAIAFAAIHGNPEGVLVYLWLGVVFARAYQQSGRLWCAVVTHFGNNAITLAILLLGDT